MENGFLVVAIKLVALVTIVIVTITLQQEKNENKYLLCHHHAATFTFAPSNISGSLLTDQIQEIAGIEIILHIGHIELPVEFNPFSLP